MHTGNNILLKDVALKVRNQRKHCLTVLTTQSLMQRSTSYRMRLLLLLKRASKVLQTCSTALPGCTHSAPTVITISVIKHTLLITCRSNKLFYLFIYVHNLVFISLCIGSRGVTIHV